MAPRKKQSYLNDPFFKSMHRKTLKLIKQDEKQQAKQTKLKQDINDLSVNVKRRLASQKDNTQKNKKFIDKITIDDLIRRNQFNKIFKYCIENKAPTTLDQARLIFNKLRNYRKIIATIYSYANSGYYDAYDFGSRVIAINNNTRDAFIRMLTSGFNDAVDMDEFGSDAITSIEWSTVTSFVISKARKPKRLFKNKNGKFFAHINTTNLDLSRYQIFNQSQAYDKSINEKREHCLFHTLLLSGVANALVNTLKLAYLDNCNIKKKDLPVIANTINRNIELCYMSNKEDCQKIYKKKYIAKESNGEDVRIAVYEDHYFIYETTDHSKYSIDNYETVHKLKDSKNIVRIQKNGTVNRATDKKVCSLRLVHKLFEQKRFQKLDMVRFEETSQMKDLKNHIYLDNIDNEQVEFDKDVEEPEIEVDNEITPRAKPKIYFADCESFVNEGTHKLYKIGCVDNHDGYDMVDIIDIMNPAYYDIEEKEQEMVNDWLNDMTLTGKHDALCYFHNLKYDYHLFEKYLDIRDICQKDNQMYSVKITFRNRSVELRDSYKLIPMALSKFSSNFQLGDEYDKKEAIAYEYYTKQNHGKRISVDTYKDMLSFEDRETFDKNMMEDLSYDKRNKTFNPTTYYDDYLIMDCVVLKKGLRKFNEIIQELTGLSIFESLTISSLTDKYMIKEGAYKGIFAIKGNLRAYIAKGVYGGRVCANEKYKKQVIEEKISDFDGVSLYPSAINRLCREVGLPKGRAKRFEQNELNQWESKTYAMMTVKITKVNKIQQMPFIAYKAENSIQYLNEPPPEDIIIDSITLQDYIKFHKIEYEIKDGVYWNEGGNKKMGEVVQRLFNKRVEVKKANPALGNVIKLMLNSAYGKTIMKKSNSKKTIVKEKTQRFDKKTKKYITQEFNFNDYVYNNFNTIKTYRKMNENNIEVEQICYDDSYNRGHVGAMVLSYSKRIMNEVFDVANDNNYPIYYTDTDSMHLRLCDVKKLEDKYRERYGRTLNGTNLEQFHTDFELKGAKTEIYAIKSIFLGKKSYLDVLESTDKDGKKINGYHIRLKGITEAGLEHSSKKFTEGYLGLFKSLAMGIAENIILNPYNEDKHSTKVLFEFKKGSVSTKNEFIRKVQF